MPSSFEPSFAQALLDAGKAVPRGIVSHNAQSAQRRFAVHRNNVVAGLVNVLQARFPATGKIVGADFFAAMARAFVAERPPRSPVLAAYGDDLPDFIGMFAPARALPYLADVARIEAARSRAYHAADAAPLGAGDLAGLDVKAAAGLRVDLHPSLDVVRSRHPAVTIWAMNSGEREPAPIETWSAQDALVVRPHLDVEVRLLPPGGAAFLLALAARRPLAAAAEAARADDSAFDLTANLAGLIGWGLLRGIDLAGPEEPS